MGKIKLADYKKVIRPQDIEEIQLLADLLKGKSLKMVNSTAVGGGVAEILNRLVPFFEELGIKTSWEVIKGASDFFAVTKAFHNALHGTKTEITSQMLKAFKDTNKANLETMSFDEDFIVIHDPQPAALIEAKPKSKAKWIWRCHIDTSKPQDDVWAFLKNYIVKYDASIFSLPWFAKELPIPQYFVYPAIDPLTEKNRELSQAEINKVLEKYKIPKNKPIITQISRFDYLKDPLGVIEAYKIVKQTTPCRLVLAGGTATDDPEGDKVLSEVKLAAGNDPDIHLLALPPFADFEVNALQSASAIVLQKSLREGFGLTVTEALWKAKPVIASAVGGITLQIKHGITGMLVHSVEGAAYQIKYLLNNPEVAKKLGELGKEKVRESFLITRLLRNYLLMLLALENPGKSVIDFAALQPQQKT